MSRHDADPISLVAGLALVAVGAAAMGGRPDVVAGRWFWPAVLLLGGLLVLVTAGAGRRADRSWDIDAAPAAGDAAAGDAHPTGGWEDPPPAQPA